MKTDTGLDKLIKSPLGQIYRNLPDSELEYDIRRYEEHLAMPLSERIKDSIFHFFEVPTKTGYELAKYVLAERNGRENQEQ